MTDPTLRPDRLPRHVAIIMDGNGRWAEARGLERNAGHRAGVAAVRTAAATAPKALKTFSTVATVSSAALRTFSTSSPGLCTMSVTASATSCSALGSGCGIQRFSTLVRGDGDTSSMTWPISSDAMPSIMAWWVLVMTAVWFFARPSTR